MSNTESAADTVAFLADAAIGVNSEAATSKTALRQSTTMLLDHFDRTPRDCEQELLEEAVTSDPPHNSSVRESGGVESRHLIDRLLAASA
ncbi:MAG: hypothetical protein ACK55I_43275, partial [bacterium]